MVKSHRCIHMKINIRLLKLCTRDPLMMLHSDYKIINSKIQIEQDAIHEK